MTDAHLQRSLAALHAATKDFTADAWARVPTHTWTNAQILEHLGKAYASTAYILDKCAGDGVPRGRVPSWRQRVFATLIIEVGYFPSGRRAPDVTLPDGLQGPEALAFATSALQALDAAAARCETHFGPRVRVANHPMLGGFTVRQWRRFHWRHTAHHMTQVARRRG